MTNPAHLIRNVIAEIADGLRRGDQIEFVVPQKTDGQPDYAGTRDGKLNRTGIASSIPEESRATVFENILGVGVGEQRFAVTPKAVERGTSFTIHGL